MLDVDNFYIGSSCYPEWWDESKWKADFAKMEALGFNAVRMGEFAWSWYEPTEGHYNFGGRNERQACQQYNQTRSLRNSNI